MIKSLPQFHLAYAILPAHRGQDVIKVQPGEGDIQYIAAVVDGWSELSLGNNAPGRNVARLVASLYPKLFLRSSDPDNFRRAQAIAQEVDSFVMGKFESCSTCVATFLFHFASEDLIVSIGDVEAYLWNGKIWYKPTEISDHALDPKKYLSNVSRFFGCLERKQEKIYSAKPDVITIPPNIPVILATDGIKDVLSVSDINAIVGNPYGQSPKKIIGKLFTEIRRRKNLPAGRQAQRDDISLLIRGF